MSHSRAILLTVGMTALAFATFPTEPPTSSAAEPKEVRFTRTGVVNCPSAKVYAGATGEVKRVLHHEGEEVRANGALAELHDPELEADLKLADAELALALASVKEFTAGKTAAQLSASPAKEQLARLEAQVKVAEARIGVLKVRATALTVRSPIEGVVAKKNTEPGNYVRKGETELFTVYDLSKPEIVVDVPELDAPTVKHGQRCTIRIDAYSDAAFEGEVDRAEPVVAQLQIGFDPFTRPNIGPRETPRTARVYVALKHTKETEKYRPLPGMTAQVGFLAAK